MNKKVILFDIDYTLFDSKLYRDLFLVSISKEIYGKNDDLFIIRANEIYLKTRKDLGYHDHSVFLKNLISDLHIDIAFNKLEQIVTNPTIIETSLYPETLPVLSALSERKDVIIGIFSGGRVDLQKKKMDKIKHFFEDENVHLFEIKKEKLKDVLSKYRENVIYLVDDVLQILSEAKKINPDIITVWIKQGRFAKNQKMIENFVPNIEINNLKEILLQFED